MIGAAATQRSTSTGAKFAPAFARERQAQDSRQGGRGVAQEKRGGEAADSQALRADVHALLADAAEHYRGALREAPHAVRYLMSRGIGGAVAARFGLGYARQKWRDLEGVFAKHGEDAAFASGLLASSGEGADARHFDRFRDRIMFPIKTIDGKVAGFGGRVLQGDEDPKYMNSPEGVGFKKRELLYGLYEAKDAIQALGGAVVVEGYLDVVSLAQAGFGASVGTLGTACGAGQIAELLKLTKTVTFCFDGDAAGRRAAARALEVVVPFATGGNDFRFMFLPCEHDPDSFVRAHGLAAFQGELAKALPLLKFLIEHVSEGCNFEYAEGRTLCAHRSKLLWRGMPEGESKEGLLDFCAQVLRQERNQVMKSWLA